MKQCIKCSSDNISTIIDKGQYFYKCNNCGAQENKIRDYSGEIVTRIQNGHFIHSSVLALIKNKDEILFVNRKYLPYGLHFPSGHIKNGETPEKTIDRELLEETGLKTTSKKLLFQGIIPDKCRLGADFHNLFLFECKVEGDIFLNAESKNITWVKISELHKAKLVPQAKILLSKIKFLDKKYVGKKTKAEFKQNTKPKLQTNETWSAVEDLPAAIILTDLNGKPTYLNKSAKGLASLIKNKKKIYSKISELAKETIQFDSCKSDQVLIDKKNINIKTSVLSSNKKIVGTTVVLENISTANKDGLKDAIAYQSSMAITGLPNGQEIIKNLLNQLIISLDNVCEIDLMLLEKDGSLKTAMRYGKKLEKKENTAPKKGKRIADCVIKTGQIVAALDTKKEKRFIDCQNKKSYSLLSVPVVNNKKIIGVLNINKPKNEPFEESAANISLLIANRIALAIENDRLYQQINSEKELFETVLQTATDGLMMTDKNLNLIFANKAAEEILELSKSDLEKHRLTDFLKNKSRPNLKKFISFVNESINKKKKIDREFISNIGPDKTLTTIFNPIIEKDETCNKTLIGIRDVTKEKAAEIQQKEFIFTATHELRTPMSIIKGYLSMVLSGDAGEINPKQEIYLNRVQKSNERLILLTEDLLQTARIEEERLEPELKNFNARDLLKDVLADFYKKAADKKIKLSVSGLKNKVEMVGDYQKIKHALSNLIDNAIKYTKKGAVKVSLREKNDYLEIEIKDTGVGIPKNQIENIFNKFYRVYNPESVRAGGAGLGLFIVKNFIEHQRGTIEVKSKLGKGTSFLVKIPINNQLKKKGKKV